jgi:hypothetical protein
VVENLCTKAKLKFGVGNAFLPGGIVASGPDRPAWPRRGTGAGSFGPCGSIAAPLFQVLAALGPEPLALAREIMASPSTAALLRGDPRAAGP